MTNGTLLEVFRKARILIESWVDDDKNRLRILHADLSEIKKHPEVCSLLQQFANHGPTMVNKLERHLEFMIENRRKYYQAGGS